MEQTGTWLLDQPLPPEEEDALIASVAAAAAPDDPRAALTSLMINSRPEAAADSLEKLTAEWAGASPNDCGEWLKTQPPPGPATDGALFAFVEEVMEHDPESAFLWTRRFDHPGRHEARARTDWEKWVSYAPVSAARFATQLDPQERQWLNLPVDP